MGLTVNKIEYDGHSVLLDKEGYLATLSDWNRDIASALALKEGIELTDAHWEIIFLLRDFHDEFEHAPAMPMSLIHI